MTAPKDAELITSTTGGMKFQKLARFDLIPVGPLWALAEHYGRNLAKYPKDNWRRGFDWSLSIAALERHFQTWRSGVDMDEEGFNHLVAVAWHAFTLLEYTTTHTELDDRWKT